MGDLDIDDLPMLRFARACVDDCVLLAPFTTAKVLAEADALVAEVRRLRAENAILKAQQCPHNSKTFGQCIICGWTGRPACSECGEPVRLDWESCPACGAWENAVEATDG